MQSANASDDELERLHGSDAFEDEGEAAEEEDAAEEVLGFEYGEDDFGGEEGFGGPRRAARVAAADDGNEYVPLDSPGSSGGAPGHAAPAPRRHRCAHAVTGLSGPPVRSLACTRVRCVSVRGGGVAPSRGDVLRGVLRSERRTPVPAAGAGASSDPPGDGGKAGWRGVRFDKDSGKWRARVMVKQAGQVGRSKEVGLGFAATEEEAAERISAAVHVLGRCAQEPLWSLPSHAGARGAPACGSA